MQISFILYIHHFFVGFQTAVLDNLTLALVGDANSFLRQVQPTLYISFDISLQYSDIKSPFASHSKNHFTLTLVIPFGILLQKYFWKKFTVIHRNIRTSPIRSDTLLAFVYLITPAKDKLLCCFKSKNSFTFTFRKLPVDPLKERKIDASKLPRFRSRKTYVRKPSEKPNISIGIYERSPTLFTPTPNAQHRHVQSILKDNLILFL